MNRVTRTIAARPGSGHNRDTVAIFQRIQDRELLRSLGIERAEAIWRVELEAEDFSGPEMQPWVTHRIVLWGVDPPAEPANPQLHPPLVPDWLLLSVVRIEVQLPTTGRPRFLRPRRTLAKDRQSPRPAIDPPPDPSDLAVLVWRYDPVSGPRVDLQNVSHLSVDKLRRLFAARALTAVVWRRLGRPLGRRWSPSEFEERVRAKAPELRRRRLTKQTFARDLLDIGASTLDEYMADVGTTWAQIQRGEWPPRSE